MTETTLTTLEALLLVLVQQGWNTPYKLKEAGGISIGAALPALNRLRSRGLLQRGEAAARRKQEFELTATGKKSLINETKRLLRTAKESPPSDAESALRLAVLAFSKNRRGTAASLLKSAGEARQKLSKSRSHEAERNAASDISALYRMMNQVCEAARMDAEGAALITLARQLRRIRIVEKP